MIIFDNNNNKKKNDKEDIMEQTSIYQKIERISQHGYQVIAELSSGANGTILLANEGSALRVIKLLKLESSFLRKSYKEECKIERKIQGHPNIIKSFERFTFYEKNIKYGVIVMEKMDGDLMDYLLLHNTVIDEEQVKLIFTQICQAVYHLHANHNIVHLDIKPDNILIHKSLEHGKIDKIKLCDFGFAQKKTCKVFENFGTDKYLAPESHNAPYPLDPSILSLEKIDIWALGITLFCIYTGYYPFARNKDGEATRNVSFDVIKKYCKNELCCDLVISMLQENPNHRPSILQVLQHPWLNALPLSYSSNQFYTKKNKNKNNKDNNNNNNNYHSKNNNHNNFSITKKFKFSFSSKNKVK